MRTFGFDWINYNIINDINGQLHIKICNTLIYTISLIWVYQVVNMFWSKVCIAFPGYRLSEKINYLMKKTRKYTLLIYFFIFVFGFRYFLDFYGITDIPVKIFGKSNYKFWYAKVYYA